MNKQSQKLQTKFTSTLKIFAGKMEETKQKQEQILENFKQTQSQENQELIKVSQQIKPKEETMAVIQNAVNLVEQQIQARDETNEILKEEAKTSKETVKSLIETYQQYLEKTHQEIDN
ncbi:hypothetical protein [endosymbiont GvMRE of Glomus versiforme]|uniref:hypothetical protein n=1 Tax=endosymbiont GvMRE of Glomus versiforme TaxID=2039283 RepID=UPI000EBA7AAB|nr:hypothetical protein [endosymbiont GvMRE of Glomus versiforme]RHZ37492.1 hypothetical protein GvMRE_I1g560 [endosymbiont GvMRE of Glomus versiforme]